MNWINLPSRDGWACSQGVGKWEHCSSVTQIAMSLYDLCWVVKATSGQKTSLSPSHSPSHGFFFLLTRNSQPFYCLHPPTTHTDIHTARWTKPSLHSGPANINICHSCLILYTVCGGALAVSSVCISDRIQIETTVHKSWFALQSVI